MALSNTNRSYGALSKTLHWTTVLLIFTVIPLGIIAHDLANRITDPAIAVTEAEIARAATLFSFHKTIGVTIFFLALIRIAWMLTQPRPGLLNADKPAEAMLAETVHWLLYGSLVLVPLSGWIHHAATTGFAPIWWPFGQTLPFVPRDDGVAATFAGLHMVLERVLVAALILHILGALKHHFWNRDATLRRMLPGRSDAPVPPAGPRRHLLPAAGAVALWIGAIGIGAGLGAYDGHAALAPAATLEEVQSDWQVTEGALGIAVTQLGSRVEGGFEDWTADITFAEPDAPGPAGDVEVTVAIPSLTLGSVASQAMGADFFDAEAHPTATFTGEITRTEQGYVATGPLTIKGNAVPITLPFELTLEDDTARMSGGLTLDRLDFGIGQGLSDEASLGFEVEIDVSLTARRAD